MCVCITMFVCWCDCVLESHCECVCDSVREREGGQKETLRFFHEPELDLFSVGAVSATSCIALVI